MRAFSHQGIRVLASNVAWVVLALGPNLGACGTQDHNAAAPDPAPEAAPPPSVSDDEGDDGTTATPSTGETPLPLTPEPVVPAEPVTPTPVDPPATDDAYHHAVEATLASVQAHLVDPFCVPCHGSTRPAADLDLTDLDVYIDGTGGLTRAGHILIIPGYPEASLIVRVVHGAMPPEPNTLGIPPVGEAQKAALKKSWIKSLPPPSDNPIDFGP